MQGRRESVSRRRRALLFCLVLASLIVVFFSDSLIRGRLLSGADLLSTYPALAPEQAAEPAHRLLTDAVLGFTPWREVGFRELSRGRVARLNRTLYCGAPHAANFQTAAYYPPRLVPASVSPRLHALGHALELFLAGLGFYLLAGRMGFGESSRWLGGLAWAFNGFLVVWKLWPLSSTAAMLPWILLGLELCLDGARRSATAITAAAVCVCWLGGHPQTATQILTLCGLYGLYRVTTEHRLWARLGRWLAACALGVGLAGFFLLPGLQYLLASQAWQERVIDGTGRGITGPSLASLPGFLFPYIWGSRLAGSLPLDGIVSAYNTNELGGAYVSFLLPLLLVPCAVVRRRRIRDFWFWALLGPVCLALAIQLPFVTAVYRALPLLGTVKPARLVLFVGLASLLLAMRALDTLRHEPMTRRERRATLAILAVAGLGAVSVAGGMRLLRPRIETEVEKRLPAWSGRLAESQTLGGISAAELTRRLERTTVRYPLWIGTLCLLAIAARRGLGAGRWSPAPFIALVVIDLFAFGRGYTPAIEAASHYPTTPTIDFLRGHAGTLRVAAAGKALPPNALGAYGLEDIRGMDALEPREYMELAIELFGMHDAQPPNFRFFAHPDYTHPIVDFLGLGHLLTDRPLEQLVADEGRRERFDLVFQMGSKIFVYHNREALPGYYLARRLVVESTSAGRLARLAAWNTSERIAVVESGEPWSLSGDAVVRRTHADDRSLAFVGDFPSPSFLAVATTYLPGWRCAIDGRPQPVVRTNHAFLGVQIPAGAREIVFSYRPAGSQAGVALSLVALLLLIVWLAGSERREPSGREMPPDDGFS